MLKTERTQGRNWSITGRRVDVAAIVLAGVVLVSSICLVPLQHLEANWPAALAGGVGLAILAHQALYHPFEPSLSPPFVPARLRATRLAALNHSLNRPRAHRKVGSD